MRILCLGGAGRICREAALDLVEYSQCERITVADVDEAEGRRVAESLDDTRVDFVRLDVGDRESAVRAMRGYDVVMDGTPIRLNGISTACIAEAGCHGINLNGFGEEDASDPVFRAAGRTCVPGFGMTPGVTQLLAMHAANCMDTVDTVRVSHGAYRPVAFSPSIAETTLYEYDPELPGRVVFEEGRFVPVPPFSRPLEIPLPDPYGTSVQYIIPHAETRTLATSLAEKGVRLIEVRGTWPERTMELLRALYAWGFLRNERIRIGDAEAGIMDCIAAYLLQAPEGREAELWGYALHVDVEGTRKGHRVRRVLTHTHPPSDGSAPGWEGLRAYTRNVGIPLAIGAIMLAQGVANGTGVLFPEQAFDPQAVFTELSRRGIMVHEEVHLDIEVHQQVGRLAADLLP